MQAPIVFTRVSSYNLRMTIQLDSLVSFLDEALRVGAFRDVSNNGLQIANSGSVSRVLTGVDASLRLLKEAAERGAQCVVCHHGLSWGDSLKRITGVNHRLVKFAIDHDIAVYAAHLPLDAHPQFGNNALLCRTMGLTRVRPAFEYHGETIGFVGSYARPITFDAFCARVRQHVNDDIRILDFGSKTVRTIGVVSGGGADMADQSVALKADVFLTGEPNLQGYTFAENAGLNMVFAGHYATEVFGVRALAGLIAKSLRLPTEFADFRIPY